MHKTCVSHSLSLALLAAPLAAFCVVVSAALAGENGVSGGEGPRIVRIDTVAPHIVGITVRERRIVRGGLQTYAPMPGDEFRKGRLFRNGEPVAVRCYDDLVNFYDRVVGPRLDTDWAGTAASYRLRSDGHSAYVRPTAPVAVYRKSRPTHLVMVAAEGNQIEGPVEHRIYLRLPEPLEDGATYQLAFPQGPFRERSFTYRPRLARSEAVHVSHLGFRPDDPVKSAWLSCWLGDGGGLDYGGSLRFSVLEEPGGREVYSGLARLVHSEGDTSLDERKRDYNGTNVYRMDFPELAEPGTYRVYVEGVGCSYPFRIAPDVWTDAFRAAAKGVFSYRRSTSFGPPHTTWVREADFRPLGRDRGIPGDRVYEAAASYEEKRLGGKSRFVEGERGPLLPDAWGGHKDAGDYQSMPRNMLAGYYLLDLVLLAPEHFGKLDLSIPESGDAIPDVIDEALWGIDFQRRTQTPEGGIRGGIFVVDNPMWAGSWSFRSPRYAYRPGNWASYVYAACAARAALALERWDDVLASTYGKSALKAMNWAEERWPDYQWKDQTPILRHRATAAAELFRLTGAERWNEVFVDSYRPPQGDTAHRWRHLETEWVYARIEHSTVNVKLQDRCRETVIANADYILDYVERTAFGWAKWADWFPFISSGGAPKHGPALVRAHVLTADEKYLRAALRTSLTGLGANPVNMCYTTGLGHNSARHPMRFDLAAAHEGSPVGINVPGPMDLHYLISDDYFRKSDQWSYWVINRFAHPDLKEWPPMESYFDVFWLPTMHEDMVQAGVSCNAYTWGHLAARPAAPERK